MRSRGGGERMKYSEFIDIVKCVINNNWESCDIDKEDEDVKLVEVVTTHNFEHWETEQIYFYILGMRDLYEISNEEWRYFTEVEE